MAKSVKARASVKASVKVGATAQGIQVKRQANAVKGVKLPYNDKGALALAQAIDTLTPLVKVNGKWVVKKAKKINTLGQAKGKALSANAQERRAWCLANLDACVIVKRETVQRKDIESENPRPENAIRVRLSTHKNCEYIGYVRYLSSPIARKNPNHKHAESVILYRKA